MVSEMGSHNANEWRAGWEKKVEPLFDEKSAQVGPAGLADDPITDYESGTDDADANVEEETTSTPQRTPKGRVLGANMVAKASTISIRTLNGSQQKTTTSAGHVIDVQDDSEDTSTEDDTGTSQGTDGVQSPKREDAGNAFTSKRKRDPLEDVTNSSPRQSTKVKRSKAVHHEPAATADENRSEPSPSPHAESGRGEMLQRKAADGSHRASPTLSTESADSNAIETGHTKSRSSGLDTQGKVDAQLLSEAYPWEDNLDTIDEEELFVEDLQTLDSRPLDHPDGAETPLDDNASGSKDDSPDVFETAPADLLPESEHEGSATSSEPVSQDDPDAPIRPSSRPATADSTPRPSVRAPPPALVPISSPPFQQPTPRKVPPGSMRPPPLPPPRATQHPPPPLAATPDDSVKSWARTQHRPRHTAAHHLRRAARHQHEPRRRGRAARARAQRGAPAHPRRRRDRVAAGRHARRVDGRRRRAAAGRGGSAGAAGQGGGEAWAGARGGEADILAAWRGGRLRELNEEDLMEERFGREMALCIYSVG